jgi:hypothetical protein
MFILYWRIKQTAALLAGLLPVAKKLFSGNLDGIHMCERDYSKSLLDSQTSFARQRWEWRHRDSLAEENEVVTALRRLFRSRP